MLWAACQVWYIMLLAACQVWYIMLWAACQVWYIMLWASCQVWYNISWGMPVRCDTIYCGLPVRCNTLYCGLSVRCDTIYRGLPVRCDFEVCHGPNCFLRQTHYPHYSALVASRNSFGSEIESMLSMWRESLIILVWCKKNLFLTFCQLCLKGIFLKMCSCYYISIYNPFGLIWICVVPLTDFNGPYHHYICCLFTAMAIIYLWVIMRYPSQQDWVVVIQTPH